MDYVNIIVSVKDQDRAAKIQEQLEYDTSCQIRSWWITSREIIYRHIKRHQIDFIITDNRDLSKEIIDLNNNIQVLLVPDLSINKVCFETPEQSKARVGLEITSAVDTSPISFSERRLISLEAKVNQISEKIVYIERGLADSKTDKRTFIITALTIGITVVISILGAAWKLSSDLTSLKEQVKAEVALRDAEDSNIRNRIEFLTMKGANAPTSLSISKTE